MKSFLSQSIFVFLLLFGIASCNSGKVEALVGGDKVYALVADLSKATTCEVFRVDDSYPGESKLTADKDLHGFTILSQVIPMEDASRKALSRILTESKTYFRPLVPPDCSFRPGIAFRFADGSIKVDLLVCFSCGELRYYLDGKVVGESFFESQKLRSLVKKLFPNDKKIQSLKN